MIFIKLQPPNWGKQKSAYMPKNGSTKLKSDYALLRIEKNSAAKTSTNKQRPDSHQKTRYVRKKREPAKSTASNVPCLKEIFKNPNDGLFLYFLLLMKNPARLKRPVSPMNRLKNKSPVNKASTPSGEK